MFFYLEVTRSSGFVLFCFILIIFRCYPEICKCTFPVLTPSFYHLTIREARLRLPWPDMSWCRLARWGSLGTITSGIVGKNFFFLFFFFFFISSGALSVGKCPYPISGQLPWPCRKIDYLILNLFLLGTYNKYFTYSQIGSCSAGKACKYWSNEILRVYFKQSR